MTADRTRSVDPQRGIVGGTVRATLAEGLLLPTGLLTAAFLTRRLGPTDYGIFALAIAVVGWIEWSVSAVFARATVKFIGESRDWQPVGVVVLRLHLAAGGVAGLLVALLAAPSAALLGAPSLADPLRLLALDIPLFCLAQAHRNILIGLGEYSARANVTATRWLVRLLLVVGLVAGGFGIGGAALGVVGASGAELLLCRRYVRPGLRAVGPGRFPVRRFWAYIAPLFLGALSLRLYDKLDLFALISLQGTAAELGAYAAAQNVALAPGLFALAFAPTLLATLARLRRESATEEAGRVATAAIRAPFLLLPAAGLVAGAAPGIVALLYGPDFGAAAQPLALLIFGALALTLISISMAILTAAERPGLTLALSAPLVPLGLVGQLLLIPRLGTPGAALAATVVAVLGAAAALGVLRSVCAVVPPARSVVLGVVLCAIAYALTAVWPTRGIPLLAHLAAIGAGIVLVLVRAGELPAHFARALDFTSLRRPRER